MRHWVFLLCLCCLFPTFNVSAQMPGTSLKGLALVHIKSRRVKDQSFQQAVVIRDGDARFIGLDDFGGIAFELTFEGWQMRLDLPGTSVKASSKKLKKLLSLPVSKQDFLAILTHNKPDAWILRRENDAEVWQYLRHKKLQVTFSDFMLGPVETNYPKHIVISYKDHLFELKWLNVEFK